jgi:DNA (cytosine-5)-methyltransferase 1
MRPRLLDLFCGAGGAAMGYHRAGFDVVGVDIEPQPNYPYEFTAYRRTGNVGYYPDLIDPTRRLLQATGLPWVMENVVGALLIDPVLYCGTMLDPPLEIQRHRLFETNWDLEPPIWPCRHKLNGRDRYPGGRSKQRTGKSTGLVRATIEIGSWDIPLRTQQQAMGIDWMTLEELSEAIPPAYTEFIGAQLLAHIRAVA